MTPECTGLFASLKAAAIRACKRCPKGRVSFVTAVMAAEPPGCAQRSVVAGERGLRGRNGAMEAPPEAPPRSGCAALAEEANQLRDVGDGGEAARRVRGQSSWTH